MLPPPCTCDGRVPGQAVWGTGSSGSPPNPAHHLKITSFPQGSGSGGSAAPVQVCSTQPPGPLLTLSEGTASKTLDNNPEQGYSPFTGEEASSGDSQQAEFVPHLLFSESSLLFHAERLWLPSHHSTASIPQPREELVSFKPKPSPGCCPLEC